MTFLELVNTLSLGVRAVSAAVIAFLLAAVIAHLQSIANSVVLLLLFLRNDPDPPHHETAVPMRDLVVWEWRDGSWALRPESGPLENAGSPPDRAGKFDGECVTRRKANA